MFSLDMAQNASIEAGDSQTQAGRLSQSGQRRRVVAPEGRTKSKPVVGGRTRPGRFCGMARDQAFARLDLSEAWTNARGSFRGDLRSRLRAGAAARQVPACRYRVNPAGGAQGSTGSTRS
jgi:hypothetical protein